MVTNTPGVLDDEVADTALGLLLMTVGELSQAERYLRDGKWADGPYPLTPATLHGRRMGILGLGWIGEAIADRVKPFGVSVAYHNRRPKEVDYEYYPSLAEMAAAVDILMIVIPGGDSTRHLVDAEVLRALGPDGILINVARSTVVDEQALVDALRANPILSAGLDVFEHEPKVHPDLLTCRLTVDLRHFQGAVGQAFHGDYCPSGTAQQRSPTRSGCWGPRSSTRPSSSSSPDSADPRGLATASRRQLVTATRTLGSTLLRQAPQTH